jgi:ABC-type phosphate transport system substrate-binding protein
VLGFNNIREHQQTMKLRTKKAGVLALAATAAMAVAGAGAGSANASLLTACTGSAIHGEGSSLQGASQSVWTTRFNVNTTGGCTVAGRNPAVTYTPTSSGRCMNGKWGADGRTALDTTVHYCGSDDAPTSTQITNINNATRSSVLSIPVTQAAIAIIVNPPAGCTISSITPSDLEKVWRGNVTTWAGISGTSGCGTNTITRVVRADSSGTTYQLKHYLNSQNGAAVCSATGRTTTTWAGLQDPSLNLVWPGVCDGPPSTGVTYSLAGGVGPAAGSGGGDEARTVAATTGSIGYAALADARRVYTGSGSYRWIPIRSGLSTLNPSSNGLSTTAANSNCTTAANAYGSSLPSATSSWDSVYLVNAGTQYPLCTLTWDLAVKDYSRAWTGSPTGQAIATTVRDYLNYVNVALGGQADVNNNDYAALPAGGGAGDVQAAAAAGIAQIVD